MTPRQPPESPDDDKQSELLRAVHSALNDITPVDEQPVPETEQDMPRLVSKEDAEVEDDRMEAYLRGPTAFTA
ncbi:hypothetical protein [Microvirga arsenatis]|uniref:Uncharacterized protein n=1 Tax=Microvirga arsenatis TaxID=2692265 RepID=A0ABW9Z230_9HYPH|nr:hypothetical protein [Microvirga arsenatis]NBJ12695.1 hypothetical protein [Microvirga arsenatis]NBJ26557.1 hypothetical protein [Microvirga arsenatis]